MAKSDSYLHHLANVPMFSTCSQKELRLIARLAEEIRVPAGRELVRQGSVGREFFVIIEGEVRVIRGDTEVAVLGPGSFFGELALLDRLPRDASVTALTPLTAMVLGQREFAGLLAESPTVTHKLLQGMAQRLRRLDEQDARV